MPGFLLLLLAVPLLLSGCTEGFTTLVDEAGKELNLSSERTPTGSDLATYTQGKILYTNNCQSCHGPIETSTKRGALVQNITLAFESVPQMRSFKSMTSAQVVAIAKALGMREPSTMTGNPMPEPLLEVSCPVGADPSVTPLNRLSKRQYVKTVRTLFGWYLGLDGSDNPNGILAGVITAIPNDRPDQGFRRMDKDILDAHVDGYFAVASQIGSTMKDDTGALRAYAGSCADAAMDANCFKSLMQNLGKKVMRRPLKTEEVESYISLFNEFPGDTKSGVEAGITSLLLAPEFLFQFETEGTLVPGKTDIYKLTDYEVASRISYSMNDSPPSNEMYQAIENGTFSQPDVYEKLVRDLYVYTDMTPGRFSINELPDMQDNYSYFFNEWLALDKRTPNFASDSIMSQFYFDISLFWTFRPESLVEEISEMMVRTFWKENLKFSQMMVDRKFYAGVETRGFYGYLEDWKQKGYPSLYDYAVSVPSQYFDHKDREGFLTRAAFLTNTGTHLTNPIQRGLFIRRKILCDDLPSPNLDALPDRALEAPEFHTNMTTRDRYAEKTKSAVCMSCHTQINPLGFALENFDSMARPRMQEKIFLLDQGGTSAAVVGTPTINSSVASLNLTPDDNMPANGGINLTRTLASSEKVQMCFARQAFRFTFGRRETTGDGCMLRDMFEKLEGNNGSMKNMFMNMALHPDFKLRKVGP